MNSDPNHYVILGQVVGVFGVKGWVKIRSDTEPRRNILSYSPWYINSKGVWQSYVLQTGQAHNKGLIAQLAGCDDRDQAAELVGCDIAIQRDQLPPAGEGEYYWSDLVGLTVQNQAGTELGQIHELLPTGANDVLVVRQGQQETLIPYVPEYYILSIDLEAGLMVVDWQPEEE